MESNNSINKQTLQLFYLNFETAGICECVPFANNINGLCCLEAEVRENNTCIDNCTPPATKSVFGECGGKLFLLKAND